MVFNHLMATRLRRAQMVERNREAVLGAARRVFIDKGYAGATLEAIAEGTAQGERVVAEYAGLDGLRMLLEAGREDAQAEAAWARVLVEFRALATRDPNLNARYAAAHARTVNNLASQLERLIIKAEIQPLFPPRMMAAFILALASGFTLESAANPTALSKEAVLSMVLRALGFSAGDETPAGNTSSRPARRGLTNRRRP